MAEQLLCPLCGNPLDDHEIIALAAGEDTLAEWLRCEVRIERIEGRITLA